MGITTVFDAGIPGDTLLNNALKALAGMERDGKLPLRYRASVYIDKRDINGEEVARNIQQKRRSFASESIDIHTAYTKSGKKPLRAKRFARSPLNL